jgi:hypothetical protein
MSGSRDFWGNVWFDTVEGVRVSNFIGGDTLGSEELGVLKIIIVSRVVEVRGTMVLLTIGVSLSLFGRWSDLFSEIVFGENTVVGDHVVSRCGLKVVQVRESSAIRVTEVHGHVGVTIVDGVAIFSVEVVQDVVLHNGWLRHSSSVGTGSLSTDAISEGKDVLVVLVLHGVFVNINTTVRITKVRDVQKHLVRSGRRVNHGREERFLDNFVSVNVSEDSNFLTWCSSLDFSHFPSEHNINVTLCALVKSDLISIREFIDVLVGSPVLHASRVGGTSVHLVLSHEVLVVKGVEVGTFTLVRSGRRVADEISSRVEPSSPVVSADSVFSREHVDVDSVSLIVFISQFSKTLNSFHGVVETGSHDEGFVGEFFAWLKGERVAFSVNAGDGVRDLKLGPLVNNSLDSVRFSLLFVLMSMKDGEVVGGLNELTLLGNESHFQTSAHIVLLEMLDHGSNSHSSHKDDVVVGALGVDIRDFGTTTGESTRRHLDHRSEFRLRSKASVQRWGSLHFVY